MQIDIDPVQIEAMLTKGGYTNNPPGSNQYRTWTSATYKTVYPGDQVALSALPYFGVFELGGRTYIVGNAYPKQVHMIDPELEEIHRADPGTLVEWVGRLKGGINLEAGQAVKVMAPSKYASPDPYLVVKDGHAKIQVAQPGSARVIVEREYLIPIKAKLVEIP